MSNPAYKQTFTHGDLVKYEAVLVTARRELKDGTSHLATGTDRRELGQDKSWDHQKGTNRGLGSALRLLHKMFGSFSDEGPVLLRRFTRQEVIGFYEKVFEARCAAEKLRGSYDYTHGVRDGLTYAMVETSCFANIYEGDEALVREPYPAHDYVPTPWQEPQTTISPRCIEGLIRATKQGLVEWEICSLEAGKSLHCRPWTGWRGSVELRRMYADNGVPIILDAGRGWWHRDHPNTHALWHAAWEWFCSDADRVRKQLRFRLHPWAQYRLEQALEKLGAAP
jgi:hypothetical protein